MEVRSRRYKLSGRIALGNSDNGLVERYCTVREVIRFPRSDISKYENQHHATGWLKEQYRSRFLYGFVLTEAERERAPFPYIKDSSRILFTLSQHGKPKN
jgi:hypothetical protein